MRVFDRSDNSQEQGCSGCLYIGLIILTFIYPPIFLPVILGIFFYLLVNSAREISNDIVIRYNGETQSSSSRRFSSDRSHSSTYTVSPPNVPDDIDNILENLTKGEIKDPVTQEAFIPGETVYLCLSHRLAYHQDSWQEIGYKCICCNHSHHTEIYIIPPCQIKNNFNKKDSLSNLIKFEDSQ